MCPHRQLLTRLAESRLSSVDIPLQAALTLLAYPLYSATPTMEDFRGGELALLWEEAVNEYVSKSKRGSIASEWKNLVNTNVDLEELIDEHEARFSTFRNHHGMLWDVFTDTMKQVQRICKVAQADTGFMNFAPAFVIAKAGLYLLDSGTAVANTYDSLEALFRKLRDVTSRLDEYLDGNVIDYKLRNVIVKLLCSLLDIFAEAEASVSRGRAKELMHRVSGREHKVQKALDQLDEMVQREMQLIAAKTYTTTQRMYADAESDRSREILREVLFTDAVRSNDAMHANNENSRLEDSGDWLIEKPLFQAWENMEYPVLWILGRPGTGKTYLASRVISHLSPSWVTGYFYISEGMQAQNAPDVILRAIAYQIAGTHDEYRRLAIRACREDRNIHEPISAWNTLFIKPLSDHDGKPLFVIIDGVDEATPKDQDIWIRIAKSLADLRFSGTRLPRIQLLFLSRPDLHDKITNAWRGNSNRPEIIQIEPTSSKTDIEKFIRKGVSEDVSLLARMRRGPSERLKNEIITKLTTGSDGLFIVAKLMLAEIENMNKPELILKTLAKPPSGLNDMFQRVITRLVFTGGFDKDDLNEIIMWVACAKRDLLLGELDLALKLRDLDQNGIVALDYELETRFGSFFSVSLVDFNMSFVDDAKTNDESRNYDEGRSAIDNPNDASDDNEDDSTEPMHFLASVKFGHASVGQYFRSAPFHEGIGLDINFAQAHVALTCLQFLTDNIPKKSSNEWRQPDLSQYSADYFLDHLCEIQLESLGSRHPRLLSTLSDEIYVMFQSSGRLIKWFNKVSSKRKFMGQLFSPATCSVIREFLLRDTDQPGSEAEDEWLQRARLSSEALLEPFAKSVAEGWLLYKDCDGLLAILFLQGYSSTVSIQTLYVLSHIPMFEDITSSRSTQRSDYPGSWTLHPNRPPAHIAEHISPEEIRRLASFDGLDESSDWHFTLASTLELIQTPAHLRAATEEFHKAIVRMKGVDNIAWARFRIAWAHYALGEYEKCIAIAEESLREYHSTRISRLLLIRRAHKRLGNYDAALAASRSAWEARPYAASTTHPLIQAYHDAGNWSEIVSLVRTLVYGPDPGNGTALFLEMMKGGRYMFAIELIIFACAKTDQLDVIRGILELVARPSAETGNEPGSALANFSLGLLHYGFGGEDEKAIQIWENVATQHPDTLGGAKASFVLAPIYLTNALGCTGEDDADLWLSKIRNLAKGLELRNAPRTADKDTPAEEVLALIGRWYAQQGNEKLARANTLPLMTLAISQLKTGESKDQRAAYHRLGRAFICSGDRRNAEIANGLLMPLQKSKQLLESDKSDSKDSRAEEDASEPMGPFDLSAACDGMCSREEASFKSLSRCEICLDVDFCDECLDRLKNGKLSYRICHPSHPFLQVYPPNGLIRKIAGGYMIRVSDEQEVTFDDWFDGISREWLGAET